MSEFQAILFSDYFIFLNKRDQKMMINYYSKKINSFIIPMSMSDKFKYYKNKINKNKFVIFAGSNFYANINGIRWYINNVVPFINIKTYFIGKNLKQANFTRNSKIIFKGYVKNLSAWYKIIVCCCSYTRWLRHENKSCRKFNAWKNYNRIKGGFRRVRKI